MPLQSKVHFRGLTTALLAPLAANPALAPDAGLEPPLPTRAAWSTCRVRTWPVAGMGRRLAAEPHSQVAARSHPAQLLRNRLVARQALPIDQALARLSVLSNVALLADY